MLRRRTVILLIVFPVIGLVVLGAAILSFRRPAHADEEFIAKATERPEVQAFLDKYPKATPEINRGSDVLVTYTISKSVQQGIPVDPSNATAAREDSYLYLRIYMGEKSLRVQQIYLQCEAGNVVYDENGTDWTREHQFRVDNVNVEYLQQGKEETCFDA